jgi:tRNA U34 5-methylaminomethyl-2-thiouridine-forming methyltransferase MnmC
MFNDDLHLMVESSDGSFTAYSNEYKEHYHSTKDGALYESLIKHVIPAFKLKKDLKEITILDICFGLGFNTLATIWYHQQNRLTSKLHIYSPELDSSLVKSLVNFTYPKEFESLLKIVKELSQNGIYKDEYLHVELFLGDAREYVKKFGAQTFDVVFQDAFSPATNPILWTKEYFMDIKNIIKDDGILSTYSIALPIRVALFESGFKVFLNSGEGFRDATIASPSHIYIFDAVNVEHKMKCNPQVTSLKDCDL